MASRRKSGGSGVASEHRRSRGVLFICGILKILSMIEIEKESCAEIARLYGKNDFSVR
jgi:hypothetical protein